jgi:hypothetical protein
MSPEFRFYERKVYTCAFCGLALEWVKRADLVDSMVLLHRSYALQPCPLTDRAFCPPAVSLAEIKGALNPNGMFLPEFASVTGIKSCSPPLGTCRQMVVPHTAAAWAHTPRQLFDEVEVAEHELEPEPAGGREEEEEERSMEAAR